MILVQILMTILIILGFGFGTVLAETDSVRVGKPAPDFSLRDQTGEMHTLSDYKGQWVLLYFYPKDDTPGCTVEACTFRDRYEDFKKTSLKIFGISTDDVKSHKAFAEKYGLPFTILADPKAKVTKKYGVKNPILNMAKRHSFLIDPESKIQKIYKNVTPADHPEEILNDLKGLQSE